MTAKREDVFRESLGVSNIRNLIQQAQKAFKTWKETAAKQASPDSDTSTLENEIDKLVCVLYNLTEEEITIMEGCLNRGFIGFHGLARIIEFSCPCPRVYAVPILWIMRLTLFFRRTFRRYGGIIRENLCHPCNPRFRNKGIAIVEVNE